MNLILTPDLQSLSPTALFDPNQNPLAVSIPLASLVAVGGSEGNPNAKGLTSFRLTIDGTVYEIPFSVRRQLQAKNGGLVRWKTTAGETGRFRYYRDAPPVFEEDRVEAR